MFNLWQFWLDATEFGVYTWVSRLFWGAVLLFVPFVLVGSYIWWVTQKRK